MSVLGAADRPGWVGRGLLVLAPVLLALVITSGILLLVGAKPQVTLLKLLAGSFGTAVKRADVAVVWVSLVICTAGLLVSFTAGQWNIGMEGQIVMGAVFATWVGRQFVDISGALESGAPVAVMVAMFAGGICGGVFWATAAGALKVLGKVHEIFAGLGLNFVASAVSIYLIFGTWKQKSGGTLSGTVLLDEQLWLPTLLGLRASPYSLVLAVVVVAAVFFALRGTLWGLQLKAVGRNLRSARTLGIATHRVLFSAYAVCGACAGLAGAVLVVGVHHRLIPGISSGHGFLGILIALLSGFQALYIAPIALFFAALSIGSIALQLDLKLDSSLAGVVQGVMVLCVLLVQGVRERRGGGPGT